MASRNQVLGLDHVVLRVRSLETSIAFYRAVMGARIERQLQTPRIVQLRIGESLLDLVPGRKRKTDPARSPGSTAAGLPLRLASSCRGRSG